MLLFAEIRESTRNFSRNPTSLKVKGRILCNIFLGDYKDFYGGFGVYGPKSDQILSKWRLMGPVWWKKSSSLIPPMIKSAQMIFFGGLFPPFHFH